MNRRLDTNRSIESLPPRNKVERLFGMIGRIEQYKNNPPPVGQPLQTPAPITSHMGIRKHPITKKHTLHRGIDLKVTQQACVATSAGIIVEIGRNVGAAGNYVVINHGNGYVTRYMHLDSIAVKIGQHVSNRQKIGVTGSTGNVTGPHLHYEVLYLEYSVSRISSKDVADDKRVDPQITFTNNWKKEGSMLPTLTGSQKNIKTNKSDKTDIQAIKQYMMSKLYPVEEEYNEVDNIVIEIIEPPKKQPYLVEPRKIVYSIPSEIIQKTNEFWKKPDYAKVVDFLEWYTKELEFDLGGYSSKEQNWIKNNLAKLANYIQQTAQRLQTGEQYKTFLESIAQWYGSDMEFQHYPDDYANIMILCNAILGIGSVSTDESVGKLESQIHKIPDMNNYPIDDSFRSEVEAICMINGEMNNLVSVDRLGPLVETYVQFVNRYPLPIEGNSEQAQWIKRMYYQTCIIMKNHINKFFQQSSGRIQYQNGVAHTVYDNELRYKTQSYQEFAQQVFTMYKKGQPSTILTNEDRVERASIIVDLKRKISTIESTLK